MDASGETISAERLSPHPDTDDMTSDEIREAIVDAEEDLKLARKIGDEDSRVWITQKIRLLEAGLLRRNGEQPNGQDNKSLLSLNSRPTLDGAALHGLIGEIVEAIEPHSESDRVAVLSNVLVAFGNVIGPIPYFRVEHTRHHLNLFIAQVGETSKGRKGTGWSTPRRMFADIDPEWSESRVTGGLSSGEGLIYAVRDERYEKRPVREKGRVADYESVLVDEGVDDKRLMLIEEELSQALKVMAREGNILSAVIRQAWDGGNLNPLTKNNPIKATGAHISVIGHITRDELLRYLNATEQANGFANRFIWLTVYRSKCIPNPVGIPEETLFPLIERLRDRVEQARHVGEIRRDETAEQVWASVYPTLSEGQPGLIGAVLGRAEAQVMRVACLNALADGSSAVKVAHLSAALALWDYSVQSTTAIFGEMTGDTTADRIFATLTEAREMTETEIRDLFGRHKSAEIDLALSALMRSGKATAETVTTGGRPKTIWRPIMGRDKSDQS
jgi:hypothetical protein